MRDAATFDRRPDSFSLDGVECARDTTCDELGPCKVHCKVWSEVYKRYDFFC